MTLAPLPATAGLPELWMLILNEASLPLRRFVKGFWVICTVPTMTWVAVVVAVLVASRATIIWLISWKAWNLMIERVF